MADDWQSVAQASAAPADDWQSVTPQGRQGGLLRAPFELARTIPQFIGALETPEGRSKLAGAAYQAVAQPILDFLGTPHKAVTEGVTPEEETEFGLNAALLELGVERPFLKPAAKAVQPIVREFKDTVATPAAQRLDAYARVGDPNGVRLEPPIPETKPSPIRPVEGSPFAGVPRSIAAKTGIPEVDSVLNSPVTKAAIDNAIIDRSRDVPYMAGGSVPLEDPTVYVDRHVPKEQEVNGIKFDPAEPWTVHENVEQHTMDILIKNGMTPEEAYRVAHFEFAEPAEQAWYRAHGIDQEAAEKEQASWLPRIQHENPENPPPNLYEKPYPHANVRGAQHESVEEAAPTPEEKARALDIIRNAPELQPKSAIPMLQKARDLGVTAPHEPAEIDPAYQQRLEKWIGKIETTDDVKNLIRQSADENNNFAGSRAAAEITLAHVERLSDAAGVDAAQVDTKLLRTKFTTPEEIRTVEQLMLRLTDKAVEAGNKVAFDATPENLEAHRAALAERDVALEYVLNLRSEWGKSGHALQQILAKSMRGINDRETQARILSEGAKAVGQPEWYYWLWMQGLLSGPFTHTKYLLANSVYAGMEHALTTPLAAVIGSVKKAVGAETDRVLFGEAMAENWGWITAFPDAIRGAAQSIKSGMRVPLQSEKDLFDKMIERGEKPPLSLVRATSEIQPAKPIPGVWGRILGAPGDVASGIHTAFKIMGERAGTDAWAYRQAASEGLKPTDGDFWNRMAYHKANVPPDVLKDVIFKAYKDTFMQPLGPHGQSWNQLVKKVPGLRWVFPFNHIPIDLIKATYEYTPVAGFDKEMRASILGKEGGIKQDKAVARIIIGSAALAYFANKFMWGNATSDYPTDAKERRQWAAERKQPNSIRIGDDWYSFERFGPAGDLARLATSVASIAQHYDGQDEERWTKMIWMSARAAANVLADEVGFQSVRNIVDAIEDQRKGARWAAWQAGSFMPYSSFLSQTASFMDPQMREAHTFANGLKYRIPFLRETLPAKRDPIFGEPLPNPGFHSVIRTAPANPDPIAVELENAGVTPAARSRVIGHTKLTEDQYDQLVATTGPLVRKSLEALVNSPQWATWTPTQRNDHARAIIRDMRKRAGQAFLAHNSELIQRGINVRESQIQPQ